MTLVVLAKIDQKKGMLDVPYVLLFLGNQLKKAGFEVKAFHCTQNESYKIMQFVKNNDVLFVGLSVATGIQCKYAADISRLLKKKTDSLIVWGGIHPSLLPEQTLSEKYVDIITIGEGEHTVVELAKALKQKKSLCSIRGIGFKENNKQVFTPSRDLEKDLSKFRPDWSLIDVESYISPRLTQFKSERLITYISSRGCPFACKFCYNTVFNKRLWRPFPKELVIQDINWLKETYDIDGVLFWDDLFLVDRQRAFDIGKNIKLNWHADVRAEFLDNNTVKKLVEAGCASTLVGAESGNDRILKLINKGANLTTKKLVQAIRNCKKHKLSTSFSFIVGLPTETWQESINTIKFAMKLTEEYPENLAQHYVGAYMPYPGTDLYQQAINLGFKPPTKTEDWQIMMRYDGKIDLPWANKTKLNALVKGYETWASRFITKTPNRFDLDILKRIFEFRVNNNYFMFPVETKIHSVLKNSIKKIIS